MTGYAQRDAIVTGMGFCLPSGTDRPTVTADEVWLVAARGASLVENNGVFHGIVNGYEDEAARLWPSVSPRHLQSYCDAQLYGLVSLHEACRDAGLNVTGEEVKKASVLTARAGVDSTYDAYHAWCDADPTSIAPAAVKSLFVALLMRGTWSDVGFVQSAVLENRGASFVASCGCASTAELLGIALDRIVTGRDDLVIVTGADHFSLERAQHGVRLAHVAAEAEQPRPTHHAEPAAAPRLDRQMRPYDRRSDCMNYGSGSATLIVESREHAERRGARSRGRILGQSTRREGLSSAVAMSTDGVALAEAARDVLHRCGANPADISYINGGAEGDRLFARLEANALQNLMKDSPIPPVSSQEACFGHSGAPLGALEAALVLMMMEKGLICPTAACEEPDPGLPFDPVPGREPRRRDVDLALSFNYQVGGVYSALLLGGPNA